MNETSFVYKTVDECQIRADLFWENPPYDHDRLPILVWIHGGALIMGNRKNIKKDQLFWYLSAGFAVISIDYRLAPETKLPIIIEDLQDFVNWMQKNLPEKYPIDVTRYAVIGHSGGGYLALMMGFCVYPRPKAIISFYGYGNIIGDWYSKPDPFYCQQSLISKSDAWNSVGKHPISETNDVNNRFLFYLYCRQNGLWPNEVVGLDLHSRKNKFMLLCPVKNIDAQYPPTMLLHGTNDSDVPYTQSKEMAAELQKRGIEHLFITIPNGTHGFDSKGIFDETIANCFNNITDFLCEKLHLIRE
jgi:acetyl esterase/lipase